MLHASSQRCLKLISDRFPGSPRVDCLTGIRMEATEPPEIALRYYEELLEADPANSVSLASYSQSLLVTHGATSRVSQAIWRRKASVYRRMGKIDDAVTELSALLDTFYTEVDGWLELADIYSTCQQYAFSSFFH